MKISTLALTTLPLITGAQVNAVVQAYWNMDSSTVSGKLAVNQSNQPGPLSASFTEIDVGFIGEIDADISGTTLNQLPPTPATNRSVGFFRAGSAYYDGTFVMNDFNFTGQSDVTVSFAYRALNVFTWDAQLEVDYRIDDGSWVDIDEGEVYSTDWTLASIAFGAALDGQTNVDFRIRTEDWASVGGYLDIDNVQVSSVPEPATYAWLLGAAAIAFAVWRRR